MQGLCSRQAALEPFKPNGGRQRASEADIERALIAAVAMSNADKPKARIVAKYNYTDADGVMLYQVLRLEPKSFRQRRPDGNGGWIWKLDDVPRVPYRLPELLNYPDATIFITEGEKDADRVASLNHCATTVAGGKWTEDCVKALAGRDCLILQDNDDAGAGKALAAAQALHSVAQTVRIVLLPDLPDGGDVSDWLDAHPRRHERLVDVCFDAPVRSPPSSPPSPSPAPAPSPVSSVPAAPELTHLIEEQAKHDGGYAVAFALLRVADQLAAIKAAIAEQRPADNRRTA